MTITISPVYLYNVARSEAEPAELWDGITERQLEDWESKWAKELLDGLMRLAQAGVTRQHWPQSWHWNWRKKTERLRGILAYQGFSIVCDGVTQGMMIVDTTMKSCRLDAQKGKNLVYIEYLENAPWNRKELGNQPRYRGIGSVLIRAAIELSQKEGFKGRVGLHSLPQANKFYANTCGMTDVGIDSNYSDLHYFEMTPDQAVAFIEKGDQP